MVTYINLANILRYSFKLLCVIALCPLVVMWIQRYLLNEDASTIEKRFYYDTVDDVVPVMSICFQQRFYENFPEQFGNNVTGMNYQNFLLGNYFEKSFLNFDYERATTNITKYLLGYDVRFRNQTVALSINPNQNGFLNTCLLYTSDAADE